MIEGLLTMSRNDKEKDTEQLRTLKEVREALSENDELRLDPGIDEGQRRTLEETALALRTVERKLIESVSDTLADRLEEASVPLEELAREIRAKVTSMNAPAKFLEHIKKALSFVTRFLTEAGRW